MDSDESNFYGDEQLVTDLEEQVAGMSVQAWWGAHKGTATPLEPQAQDAAGGDVSHLHNPYASNKYARQPEESVDAFLNRLPPSTTEQTPGHNWIWIYNPYRKTKTQADAQNRQVPGGEDEVPEAEGADLLTMMQAGQERLDIASSFCNEFRNSGHTMAVISRETRKAGIDAAKDILGLAEGLSVTCGKWMLFCPIQTVDEVWALIAKATANNELGIGAKVAAKPNVEEKPERLICVYTENFANRADVVRVAEKLKQLGLLRRKPLYYKPDAYTYLGIASGNPWNIRPTIYDTASLLNK
ncbi:DUF1917-domain-containing protein [Xylariaceae sp. FL0594]|nr:DUF1917-domain-containing protein [Xylariaceae sp. FL0594]